jgi:hypothetical protein
MKRTKCMAIFTVLLLAAGVAAAQSLGDYARAIRKNKPETTTPSRHYDNDNLPTGALSVVGPPPTATNDAGADTAKAGAAAPAASDAERQKQADDWNNKVAEQKKKIDSLNHELDVDQREMRLRALAETADPSVAARNLQWGKDDVRYKSEIDEKQKALADAQKELEDMQDQGHKAGYADKAAESSNDNNKDKDQDQNKDQNQ